MTHDQFDALATLARWRAGVTEDSARAVLCDGKRPCDVARELGTTAQNVNNAVTNARRVLRLAETAAGRQA